MTVTTDNPPNEPHKVGDRGVEEVLQVGREDGDVDVRPGEGVEKGADRLAHQHQLVQVGEVVVPFLERPLAAPKSDVHHVEDDLITALVMRSLEFG